MAPLKYNYLKHTFLAILFCLIMFALTVTVGAFAQGYASNDEDIRPGMSVALSESSTADAQQVERATQDNPQKIIGIATDAGQNLATSASGEHQVYVQSSGTVEAFVSDLNGGIKKGDTLTISPLRGILMKANGDTASIGVALEDFDTGGAEQQTINTEEGSKNVLVTKLEVSIAFSIPGDQPEERNDSALERIGRAVTGKDVSEVRVASALLIFLIMMVAEGGIIYGAVSSAIISMGRNPFSKGIIESELLRILIVVVIVLVVGLASIYAVLSI